MNDKTGKTAKLFWIILTSLISTALIIIVSAIFFSIAAVFIFSEKLENVTEIVIPEPAKEKSSCIYVPDGENEEYKLIYKVTPYSGDVNIEIDAAELPEYVKNAFVSIEDERFYDHEGIDIITTTFALTKEIMRVLGFYTSGDRTGGSTITQQLVKNITSDDTVSVDRKLREISRAVNLENQYSKEDILEKYLNIIYFGQNSDGLNMYGIEAAAIGYFGKHAKDLTISETACLAAIPQNPYLRNPLNNDEGNSERRIYCLKKMFELGYISSEEYEKALNTKLTFSDNVAEDEKISLAECTDDFINPEPTTWVIDTALSEFCDYICELKGIDREAGMTEFMNGGYELYLTVDENIQNELEKNFSDYTYFPEEKAWYTDDTGTEISENIQAAAVVMDYKGRIKGIVGRIGEKKESFCWNNALHSHRQPGSTIKPLTSYGYALENDLITWSDLFYDTPLPAGIAAESEWPVNYNGTVSGECHPLYEMIAHSYNTVPAQLCNKYGLENIFDFSVDKLHLNLDRETDMTYAALSIGATGTGPNLINLANAYMPFGNGGIYYDAHIINRIKDSCSSRVYVENDARRGERVIKEETAFIMNRLLRQVVEKGTGKQALLKNKNNIGKTGTTENYRDILFAGLTEDFVSVLWIGYENAENPYTLKNTSSAGVWKGVFGNFADNYISGASFPECENVIYTDYCAQSGLPASSRCISGGKGYYRSENIHYCNISHNDKSKKHIPSPN